MAFNVIKNVPVLSLRALRLTRLTGSCFSSFSDSSEEQQQQQQHQETKIITVLISMTVAEGGSQGLKKKKFMCKKLDE